MTTFKDDLIEDTDYFFEGDYDVIEGRNIPDVSDLQLGRHGKKVELAMLYIDIKESTKIVDSFRLKTSARMYQSFLRGVTKISRKNNGEIVSFNGDGVLVAFYGNRKCNDAVRSAMQMMEFVNTILKPKIHAYFNRHNKSDNLFFDCGIGIDMGDILIVRGGIKGLSNSDLVWVGNPTNLAVKLSAQTKKVIERTSVSERRTIKYNIHITNTVYNRLDDDLKKLGTDIFSIIWLKYDLPPTTLATILNADFCYRTNKTLPL